MACPFLDKAPLEIRNKTYSYLLSAKYTKRPVRDDEKPSRVKRGLRGWWLYDFQPAILLTNKRINIEARHFLYEANLFVLVRYPPPFREDRLRTGGLTLLAVKEDEVHCSLSASRISLHVDLQYHDHEHEEHRSFLVKSGFVMAANELGILCRILKGLDQECPGFLVRLNVKLGVFPRCQLVANASAITESSSPWVWDSRPFPEQRMLLEPFSTLHSVKNLEIASVDGKTERVDAQLMQEVKERAGGLPPDMKEVMVAITKFEDLGNEAFRAGDFWHAAGLYTSARQNLKSWNYLYYKTTLSEPAEFVERVRIQSSHVAALLRLQLWSQAHAIAISDIEEIACIEDFIGENYYDPGELAKLHYLRALASEGMGKLTQAVKEICEALSFDPNNMEMRAILEKWEKSAK